MHIASAEEITHPGAQQLHNALNDKAQAWTDIIKIGRTHTQMRHQSPCQEFSGYAKIVEMGLSGLSKLCPAF